MYRHPVWVTTIGCGSSMSTVIDSLWLRSPGPRPPPLIGPSCRRSSTASRSSRPLHPRVRRADAAPRQPPKSLSRRRIKMRNRFMFALTVAVLAAVTMFSFVEATPIVGVTSTSIAQGQFGDIDAKTITGDWHAKIDTKGESDLFVLENRIIPGGT